MFRGLRLAFRAQIEQGKVAILDGVLYITTKKPFLLLAERNSQEGEGGTSNHPHLFSAQ